MNPKHVLALAELFETYYDFGELIDVAALFDVRFKDEMAYPGSKQEWLSVAKQVFERLDHGNYRALIDTLIEHIEVRNTQAIATTTWERRVAHESNRALIRNLQEDLGETGAPSEITVGGVKPFAAKSQIRELLEQATTDVFIVDPYVGVGTLDCLRGLQTPARLLTATAKEAIETGFERALADFKKEGFAIEVRRVAKLHDRHLVFNDRCWLVGSSLKDAGKKAFHCMEIVDTKAQVLADLNAKWASASPFS